MDAPAGGQPARKLLPAVGLAAAAIFVAIVVILATQPKEPAQLPSVPDRNQSEKTQPFSPAEAEVFSAPNNRGADRPSVNTHTRWEERLDAILTGESSNKEAVRRLLQDFNTLPPEAQTEYIAHALNLCEDDNYEGIEAIYMRADTVTKVREQIFDDVLNRPDDTKLPMMARTMAAPNHPLAGEAKDILTLYLDLDPDTPGPVDWSGRVRSYLQENTAGN